MNFSVQGKSLTIFVTAFPFKHEKSKLAKLTQKNFNIAMKVLNIG